MDFDVRKRLVIFRAVRKGVLNISNLSDKSSETFGLVGTRRSG
jgi:hypothetical protein